MYDSKYNMLLKNESKKQLIKIKNFEQKKTGNIYFEVLCLFVI